MITTHQVHAINLFGAAQHSYIGLPHDDLENLCRRGYVVLLPLLSNALKKITSNLLTVEWTTQVCRNSTHNFKECF